MNKKANGSKTQKNVSSKAERIISAIREKTGETAASIAKRAGVDHNHVYLFQGLVEAKILKRLGKRGRGCTYDKGSTFPKGV